MKKSLIATVSAAVLLAAGCGGGTAETNSNAANVNANRPAMQNVHPKDLPPGLSTSPVAPSANTTPGIPAPGNANVLPKGTTPTPGIPDPKTIGKPMKPGATPTPGIPDPETVRRQMQQLKKAGNGNPLPPPPPGIANSPMMRKQPRKPANVQ